MNVERVNVERVNVEGVNVEGVNNSNNSVNFGERDNLKCLFCSSYNRGLEGVLDSWLDIRREFPTATLDIYYGRETWGILTKEKLSELIEKIESLKLQGVNEMGRVSHRLLFERMHKASVLVNISRFEETYGIVFAKAMAAGMSVVGTDVIDSKIVHPSIELMDRRKSDEILRDEFTEKLIGVLRSASIGELEEERGKYIQYAKDNLTWYASALRLVDFIEETLD